MKRKAFLYSLPVYSLFLEQFLISVYLTPPISGWFLQYLHGTICSNKEVFFEKTPVGLTRNIEMKI